VRVMDSTTNSLIPPANTAPTSILTEDDLFRLRRVIVITNGKGGVGKTSVTTNIGTLLAQADYKVLIVDLDSQGNVANNLGFDETDKDDGGAALHSAAIYGRAPEPIRGIRANLDVLPGGTFTDQLMDAVHGDSLRGGKLKGCVARAIAKIAPEYDIILIDTPPSSAGYVYVEEAMLASRWILAPLRPEPKSIKGLESLADRISRVQSVNPYIQLLGVILFGVPTGATRVEKRPRDILGERLAGIAPTFSAKIRNVVAADADASFRGEAAHELAAEVANQGPFWERLRNGKSSGPTLAGSAGSLAEDYMSLATEIVDHMKSQEEALEAGAN
jgi:chromosome partitioning protein